MKLIAEFPWLQSNWSEWQQRRQRGRVPHALLITGQEGLAKRALASAFTAAFLCEQPDEHHEACGSCRSCRLLEAGSHPDHLAVTREDDSKVIKIDQIRALSDSLSLTSQYGRGKCAVVFPAEAMNAAAANSLLKTLEEPAGNTLLLLVSSQPSRLPATIRSRCQQVRVNRPDSDTARQWLQDRVAGAEDTELLLALSGGAPLAALALRESGQLDHRREAFEAFCAVAQGHREPVAVAAAWSKIGLPVALDWLSSWAADLVRLLQTGRDEGKNLDVLNHLRKLAEPLDLVKLHAWLQKLYEARRLVDTPVVAQLVLEDLLLEWIKVSVPLRR